MDAAGHDKSYGKYGECQGGHLALHGRKAVVEESERAENSHDAEDSNEAKEEDRFARARAFVIVAALKGFEWRWALIDPLDNDRDDREDVYYRIEREEISDTELMLFGLVVRTINGAHSGPA